jgi:hypothetical protein
MLLVDGEQHHFLFWIILEILENGLNLMKITIKVGRFTKISRQQA